MKFWRMTGLIAASPVDIILDKGNYTLEELLDEEEIIHEYRARNARLINYLRNRAQVERLLHYIVEEAPENAEEKQIFKFPFIACEIFICEVDVILSTLVEDEELMNMLFSFLKPDHPRDTLLAGYFGKVVMCLILRKTAALMNYVQNHQEIIRQLVDLIGITSIMEVLIRLIGADETMYANYVDEMQWLKDTNVLEMIVDKFNSSDSPEVHANASEVLCAIVRYAPPGLAAEICSSSFMGKLFHHALDGSRPKSVLIHSLSVCISVLDPKRIVLASYNLFRSQLTHGSLVAANPETIDGMLESLGDLLKLLDVTSATVFFPTTYGYLKPPFGKHRLKIVEFIAVLLTIGSEAAERELVQRGAIKHIINMFFEYPFNNFLHRSVENIIELCLESKNAVLIEHLLQDCDIVNKILGAEKQPLLLADCSKPTIATRGRLPPRIGNFGHMTCIANKLIQLAYSNNLIQTHLRENKEWVVWHANVLLKRNATENVHRWACGRPYALQDQLKDSDNDGFRDTEYDGVALPNNSNQALSIEGTEQAHLSQESEAESVYFDNETAEVISSLRLAENSNNVSLFANSSWFSYEEGRVGSDSNTAMEEPGSLIVENGSVKGTEDTRSSALLNYDEEPTESIGSKDTSDSSESPDANPIASSQIPELKVDEDQLTVNGTIEANTEDCSEHACAKSGNSYANPRTLDCNILPTPETGNPCANASHESIHINSDPGATPSADDDAANVVTPVSSEDASMNRIP